MQCRVLDKPFFRFRVVNACSGKMYSYMYVALKKNQKFNGILHCIVYVPFFLAVYQPLMHPFSTPVTFI